VVELAGDPAHREAVAPVRGHVDLDDLLAETQEVDRRVARLADDAGGVTAAQHDDAVDPVRIRAQAQFLTGADHAVGEVAIGLASSDGERAGQHGAGQGDHHEVSGLEVVSAADDPAAGTFLPGLRVLRVVEVLVVFGPHVHTAPVDGLAVLLGLLVQVQDLADDQRTGHLGAVDGFFLETHGDEVRGDLFGIGAFTKLHVLPEPAERDEGHVRSPFRSAGRSGRRPPPGRACP
jgi:hypothetical protein